MISPDQVQGKRILFSALNWGMGHVTRSIPLLRQLQSQYNTLFIAADQDQKEFLLHYLSDVTWIDHAGYPFNFRGLHTFERDLFLNRKALWKRYKSELKEVDDLVKLHTIDLVISDHRYGFRSSDKPSIVLTHQVNLPLGWYEFPLQWLHTRLLRRFDAVWICDTETSRFAGKLSKTTDRNALYIGPLSRFSLYDRPVDKSIEQLVIASGPDPYAQQLIDELVPKLSGVVYTIARPNIEVPSAWIRASNNPIAQDEMILNAKKIISRSGYSTLMDLDALQCEGVLIPTKGQREQLYLAEIHSGHLNIR